MNNEQKLNEWKSSVELYIRNAKGLHFETFIDVDCGKIIISNNAPAEYKEPINSLANYISDINFVIEILTDPYSYSLPGFEIELKEYYPELLKTLFNKGYDEFLLKLWSIENVLMIKYLMQDISLKNGEWSILVRKNDGNKTYYRRNGHFEDDNGFAFTRGYGLEQLFWNMFDDKSEYKVPIIDTSSLKRIA